MGVVILVDCIANAMRLFDMIKRVVKLGSTLVEVVTREGQNFHSHHAEVNQNMYVRR